MFRVYFTNHGYFSDREFDTLADAVTFAKSTTFDSQIYRNATGDIRCGAVQVASWSYFGGLREHHWRELL